MLTRGLPRVPATPAHRDGAEPLGFFSDGQLPDGLLSHRISEPGGNADHLLDEERWPEHPDHLPERHAAAGEIAPLETYSIVPTITNSAHDAAALLKDLLLDGKGDAVRDAGLASRRPVGPSSATSE